MLVCRPNRALPGFTSCADLRHTRWRALESLAAEKLPSSAAMLRPEATLLHKAAESDYNKRLELLNKKPNDELQYALLVNRGLLWLERKEWGKAIADLESAIRKNGAQWQAHEMLAQVYDRAGKPELAIAQFTEAIRLSPKMAALYRACARVDLRRKKQTASERERAIHDLETAVKLEPAGSPHLPADQTNRAQLLHRQGREEEALRSLCGCDRGQSRLPGRASPADRRAAEAEAPLRGHPLVRRPALARQTVSRSLRAARARQARTEGL